MALERSLLPLFGKHDATLLAISSATRRLRPRGTEFTPLTLYLPVCLCVNAQINKGQIEMISRVHLVKQGDRVGNSEAALLQKLNVKPFSYGLQLQYVYDNGDVFDPAVLDIAPADIFKKLGSAISTLAAVCLEIGYPTKASVPHTINNAFKTLVAIALETDYKFPRATTFADFIANPANFVVSAAAPAAGGAAPAAAAAKKEESESEESVAGGGGGLFGDDEEW